MTRTAIVLLAALILTSTAFAQSGNVYHKVTVVDEYGEVILTQVYIYVPGTTTAGTIYADWARTKPITQPITPSSTNSTLSGGTFSWYGPDGYDYKLTTTYRTQDNADAPSLNSSMNTIKMNTAIALDNELYALSGIDPNAMDIPYFPTTTTASSTPITVYTKTLLDDANASAARSTLSAQKAFQVDVTEAPYSADSTGATDAATAIQTANDAAELVGGTVFFPPGTYLIASDITVDASVNWEGSGATLLLDGGDITITGAMSDAEAVTAAVARGDISVTVADESAFSAGDLILISGHASASYTASNERMWGEYAVVESTSSGSVAFENRLIHKQDATDYPGIKVIAPIAVELHGLTIKGNNAANSLYFWYCKNSGLYNCKITGQHSGANRIVEANACLNFKVQGCSAYDVVSSYPFLARRCVGLTMTGNTVTDCTAGLICQWSTNITITGNVVRRVQVDGIGVWDSFTANITGNTVGEMPDTKANYEASSTGCDGIQIYGCENLTITGNSLYNCHGEGDIYLRVGTATYDDGTYMAPCENITISNNIVQNTADTASAATNHLGCIYAKTYGNHINVSGNTLVFYSKTQLSAAITFSGVYNWLDISNNIISTQHQGIGVVNNTGVLYPLGFTIKNNDIYLLADLGSDTYGAIRCGTIENGSAYERIIEGNTITGVAQTGSQYHISIGPSTTSWVAGSRLWVIGNTVKFASDAAGRGLSVSGITSGTPDAGQVRVEGNDFSSLGGDAYATAIEPFVIEQVATFTDDDTTPDTYGLSKMFKATNTHATSITDFLQPVTGQVIQVFATNGNTTIVDGSGIELFNGANYTMVADQVLSFVYDGTDWNQIGSPGYTNLTSFVDQTAWRVFYSDGSGDIKELALGAAGEVLTSGGAAAAPSWTGAGAGDITSVWSDDTGDVSALTAAAGDTLDATSADSTVPWKVNAAAAPTVEGQAIWESDADTLRVGDGAATLSVAMTRDKLSAFAATSSAELQGVLSDETGTGGIVGADSPTFVDDITIAAAGVKLTGSDGDLTILGAGDGFDEDLRINLDDIENTATVDSTTGLATINFSGINLQVGGVAVLSALAKDIVTTSPLTVNAGANLDNVLPGSDADVTFAIADAAADGATKGAAAFTANDFDAAAGVISLDYVNGQVASAVQHGFLTDTDWSTFNGKMDGTLAKDLVAGTGLSGGADDILPGADADVTVAFDSTEVEATTWGAGGNASNIWSFDLSGTDTTLTMGSALFTFSHAVTSGGTITSSGTFDVTGATGMVLGSADVTGLTITTDGTGNGELTLPNDSIGDADIDWGTGAGQVSIADVSGASATLTVTFALNNPTTACDKPCWLAPYALTITAVQVLCTDGTNWVGHVDEFDADGLNAAGVDGATDITAAADTHANDDGALSNPVIDAGDYVGAHTTSVSGSPTLVLVTIKYTIN